MSTKNLARTIIEPGRSGSDKYERKAANKLERRVAKTFLRQVIKNKDLADLDPPMDTTRIWGSCPGWKVGPLQRWFNSQAGKSWNDVYSLVSSRWDVRTQDGRTIRDRLIRYSGVGKHHHISELWTTPPPGVDEDGLCHSNEDGWRSKYIGLPRVPYEPLTRSIWVRARGPQIHPDKRIAKWLNFRKVGRVGRVLFWYVPTRGVGWNRCHCSPSGYPYFQSKNSKKFTCGLKTREVPHLKDVWEYGKKKIERELVRVREHYGPFGRYCRQDRKLNDKEIEYWNKLTEHQKGPARKENDE